MTMHEQRQLQEPSWHIPSHACHILMLRAAHFMSTIIERAWRPLNQHCCTCDQSSLRPGHAPSFTQQTLGQLQPSQDRL